jgi:starch synthase
VETVFVSTEVAPLAKVGGLADVAGALPWALRRVGQDVSVMMPYYRSIDRRRFRASDTGVRVSGWMDGTVREAGVFVHRRGDVPVYLIKSADYFDRDGVYGEHGADYVDNAFRFGFFARAVIEAVKALDLHPDVLHVNDWTSALVPAYRNAFHAEDPVIGSAAVVLSIHNLAYQGTFDKSVLPRLGIPWELFTMEALEYHDRVNFLKGGLGLADLLSTVSPTYAREIQTPEYGAGLDGILRRRSHDLVGILNGIDPVAWNPRRDRALPARFSARDLAGKAECKAALQRELGLDEEPSAPLFGLIGRLDPQKGFDLALDAAASLVADGAQLVLLGAGQQHLVDRARALAEAHPTAFSANFGFDDPLARRIYAGADLLLMPSRFEPCGLAQMIAFRYGTIPVVRRTGGLADTVIDLDDVPPLGNGFVFDGVDAGGLLWAARRAMTHLRDRGGWRALMVRGMALDFSWEVSARRYLGLYVRAASEAKTRRPA